MNARIDKVLPSLASLAVGIIPVVILIQCFGVSRRIIIGWGVLSYILGTLVIKMPVYHFLVVKLLHPRLSHLRLAVAQGIVSSVSELGASLIFFIFVLPDLTLPQLIGFGVAAGALEAVMLAVMHNPLRGTPLEQHATEVFEAYRSHPALRWMGVVERILALITHAATRGLVYISTVTGNVLPGLIALATFAALDGRAYYAHIEKWRFDEIHVLAKFYKYAGLVAALQLLSFVAFYAAM